MADEIIIKSAPTAEELAQCPTPQYVNDPVPLTKEQVRNREKSLGEFRKLKEQSSREFDISRAIESGLYEVH